MNNKGYREYRNMPNLKGAKTEKNLMEAFEGESQARNKYTSFATCYMIQWRLYH